jgi:OmpA-OmpF porin, OOP family
MPTSKLFSSFVLVGSVALLTAGCATKKYVAKVVHPLELHVNKVDQATQQNAQDVKDLDAKTERGISDAQNSADKASQSAQTADQHAQSAQTTADEGVTEAKTAKDIAENVDQFQPAQNVTVLFKFNSSKLTKDAQASLDQFAQSVQDQKHYAIQIQGYTDKTGPEAYNLELSRKRADAVVRYLTLNYKIPLVKIYMLGYGEAAPAAENKTREGRKENRRVQLTLLVPPTAGAQQQTSAQSSPGAPQKK